MRVSRVTLLLMMTVVVLTLAMFWPGSYHSPYQIGDDPHRVVHEDESGFAQFSEEDYWDSLDVYQVDELSPEARRLFDRTREDGDRMRGGSRRGEGWQRFTVTMCRDHMLVCDTYKRPPEFDYSSGNYPAGLVLIEDESGDRWLFDTNPRGYSTHWGGAVVLAFRLITVFPLLAFVSSVLWRYRHAYPGVAAVGSAAAAKVGLIALAYPYVEMIFGIDLVRYIMWIILFTGTIIVGCTLAIWLRPGKTGSEAVESNEGRDRPGAHQRVSLPQKRTCYRFGTTLLIVVVMYYVINVLISIVNYRTSVFVPSSIIAALIAIGAGPQVLPFLENRDVVGRSGDSSELESSRASTASDDDET